MQNIPKSTFNLRDHIKELLLSVLFLLAYSPVFQMMWYRWFARDSYYSHGILIPFVAGYLIWQKKDELKEIVFKRSAWGMVLIATGLLFYMGAAFFRFNFGSAFSMLIVLSGLILHVCGTEMFKKILFPFSFLIFMVPIPSVVITNLSFGMKIFAAEIATSVLNQMGLVAIRDGSLIKMAHAYVIVDDVCSGLRSLISLMALGSIIAYWLKGPMVKRVILFLTTIPIAVVTNMCRIIFLASVSEIWGPQYAEGFLHDASGFMVFALAFVMLFAVGRLLE